MFELALAGSAKFCGAPACVAAKSRRIEISPSSTRSATHLQSEMSDADVTTRVPSLPRELVSIVARFLEPSAWNTARALSKMYRKAVHERTKDPAALEELIVHMQARECSPLHIGYPEHDPQSALLERHFPTDEGEHHGFVRLSVKLMLDLAEYLSYDRANHYSWPTPHGGTHFRDREIHRGNITFIDSRADVEEWMGEVMRTNELHYCSATQSLVAAVWEEPHLWSTLRWVTLRMVDRVRFGHFYFERHHGEGRSGTQLMPLIWEMR